MEQSLRAPLSGPSSQEAGNDMKKASPDEAIDVLESNSLYQLTPLHSDLKKLTNTIQLWLETYSTSHELCVLKNPANVLPTRLIDVGTSHSTDPLRLCVSTSLMRTSFTRLDYVALSYCWGSTQHSALTTSHNFPERLREIKEESLPKSIRDAILMARELGIRFLWVDALCIIQPTDGNSSDWDIESLSAVGSDSADGLWRERTVLYPGSSSSRPIFPMRTRKEQTPMRATKRDSSWRKEVQRSTLRDRGWVLQELILSPRIVYWTSGGTYWDCCSCIASEFTPITLSLNAYDRLDPVREIRLHLARARGRQDNATVLDRWYGIVVHYSCMQLSYPSDTLPAISGIAKAVQGHTPPGAIEYAAGIWVNSQDPQFSWFDLSWRRTFDSVTSPTSKTSEASYIAPSWSWASAGAPILYPDRGRRQGGLDRGMSDVNFKILDVELHLSGKAQDTMGQLRSGVMYLRGAIPVNFTPTLRPTKNPHHWFEQEDWGNRVGLLSKQTNFFFDKTLVPQAIQPQTFSQDTNEVNKEGVDSGVSIDVTCIIIGHLGSWQYGILLKPLPDYEKRFRRIGILQRHESNRFQSTKIVDIELV